MNQPTKKSGAFIELANHARMVLALLKHPRVHILIKLLPILAVVYVIVPADLIPIIPVISAFDDIAILGAAISIFYVLVPSDVIDEINQHLNNKSGTSVNTKIDDQIIDGEFIDIEDEPKSNS